MGKILIIKNANFSLNAIDNVDYEAPGNTEPSGGDDTPSTPGTPSNPPSGGQTTPTLLFSPLNIALAIAINGRSPLVYYVPGVSSYNETRVAAIDVSALHGRTLHITREKDADNGYAFLGDTSTLGVNDVANIEEWDPANFTAAVDVYKAELLASYCISFDSCGDDGEDMRLTVPASAKWLVFGTKDLTKARTTASA